MTTKVLVSAGFGAGWSTWNTEWDGCATDAGLVALVEAEDFSGAIAYAEYKWEGCYTGGLRDCYVVEVAAGDLYQVREYDGAETLVVFDPEKWNRG
jgi:hypothetical protein